MEELVAVLSWARFFSKRARCRNMGDTKLWRPAIAARGVGRMWEAMTIFLGG